jgi:hypothetical protein
VTVFLGHNDVCRDVDVIPTDDEFKGNIIKGLEILKTGLPKGATIYVVGLVNISQLWDAIEAKKALGIVDCQVLWDLNPLELLPSGCRELLRTEEGRALMENRIEGFNGILADLVKGYDSEDPNHYYYYTDSVFANGVIENEISDIDCYHPSACGQEVLSDITWQAEDGPLFGE